MSLLRKNIREYEINALNADIREINAEILELEYQAEKIKTLV
jgi:ribosomal protein L29